VGPLFHVFIGSVTHFANQHELVLPGQTREISLQLLFNISGVFGKTRCAQMLVVCFGRGGREKINAADASLFATVMASHLR
jgi:hypothetical protein